ncbi:uncharacterized protein TRAVEDRAFT_67632 [Trametes versicolor FP-101664 SS1]|uniref:Altered inheritance of mitochondria protein 11 n=1 Tax=Trametes versicolor (strain FP-101664) TaxID=717944 RepID=R7S6K6_TRAVS|nr:uncharacterized protein TRAVEDRAFT_67632 [Trametes versicolor FP-101664 SS1]EIW51568.1 hypothetical protein TRAVEDRAFT_67632 [Trametes versicolor FP-101664 SS1]
MSASSAAGPSSSSTPLAPSNGREAPESDGYRAIFGKDKKPIPRWVPIALLAFSTVAMSVPILMLRRSRAATLGKALAEAPPPPTRRSTSAGIPIVNPNATSLPLSIARPRSLPSTTGAAKPEDDFNGALHCAKAFGLATLLVGTGALTTVWGIRTYMGVETTQEFADRMRLAILSRMPQLSSRIHRLPEVEDDVSSLPGESSEAPAMSITLSPSEVEGWNWPAAEQRLREAFDKDGFSGWAAAALRELEAEGRRERTKRGHV